MPGRGRKSNKELAWTASAADSTQKALPWASQAATHTTPPGLENIGNSCYMNSCLQLLCSVQNLEFVTPLEQINVVLGNINQKRQTTRKELEPIPVLANGTDTPTKRAVSSRQRKGVQNMPMRIRQLQW